MKKFISILLFILGIACLGTFIYFTLNTNHLLVGLILGFLSPMLICVSIYLCGNNVISKKVDGFSIDNYICTEKLALPFNIKNELNAVSLVEIVSALTDKRSNKSNRVKRVTAYLNNMDWNTCEFKKIDGILFIIKQNLVLNSIRHVETCYDIEYVENKFVLLGQLNNLYMLGFINSHTYVSLVDVLDGLYENEIYDSYLKFDKNIDDVVEHFKW